MTKALDAAEDKGRQARLGGKERSACPYVDRRTRRGAITWSRALELPEGLDPWPEPGLRRKMHKPTPEKGKTMTAYEAVRSPSLGYTVVEAWLMLIWKGWPMGMAWKLAKGESPVGPPMKRRALGLPDDRD